MKHEINLSTWPRRQHFEFFVQYEIPFWGTTVHVDCTRMYEKAKKHDFPFSLGYHYASLRAVNAVEEFRHRIEDDKPVCYDVIHASTTIARPDGTFGFSYHNYTDNFDQFIEEGIDEYNRVKNNTALTASAYGQEVVYFTVLRNIRFTAVDHPQRMNRQNAIPIITFGEMFVENERRILPHSVHAHHALVDGQHVSRYFQAFQQFLNK
jgi:chloramphenicol O-acetyltransferase type A